MSAVAVSSFLKTERGLERQIRLLAAAYKDMNSELNDECTKQRHRESLTGSAMKRRHTRIVYVYLCLRAKAEQCGSFRFAKQ